jgi:AraC family transcriptional regulator
VSLSYVHGGSLTYQARGRTFELVPGSILVGRPELEYVCSHERGAFGEGLSFRLAPDLVDEIGGDPDVWQVDCVQPLAELTVLGGLAQAAAEGKSDIGLDEVGVLLVGRLVEVLSGRTYRPSGSSENDRRCAIDAALWIDAHSQESIDLEAVAKVVALSRFHFLRIFSRVIGVTPHQYLVRCRLRKAARLLVEQTRPISQVALDVGFGDLSNFVRTFHRAAGVSPRGFRRIAKSARFSK